MTEEKRVLIVDDEEALTETLSDILEAEGYTPDVATTGEEEFEKVKDRPYPVVLMDIRMPGMNGVEALREIRRVRPVAKVLMITAYSGSGVLEEALEAGARDFRYKPLDIDRLFDFLDEAFDEGAAEGRRKRWA